MTLEQRLTGGEVGSDARIYERGNSLCKAPEVEKCLCVLEEKEEGHGGWRGVSEGERRR